ncbi:MAG TPA: DEAD/DEAH box helicase [Ruminococcaceae bacterium]|jgi:ATP-dependent RNA helicase RhlE|nr:DEAD/DEAH box helicase [Oscillospiraceae bacterium]HCM24507.1 DEAD/DEAH box helicase [Oscillospiraceae bacterium]
MDFKSLKIIPPILRNLEHAGYKTPTPIQQEAIPQVLQGRDLFGCAQTGTGKTAAFAVPILQHLEENPVDGRPVRTLVLTPTRELAIQIFDNFREYGKGLHQNCCVVFGGVNQAGQVKSLRQGADVLVATPGRLNDLVNQGYIDLSQVEIFVLDEADRMLDMGFIHDVKRVISQLPQKRQNLMFSATLPKEIRTLVAGILQNPVKISITPPATTVERIDQSVYYVDKSNKCRLLVWVLKDPRISSALVFTRTKHGADRVVRDLTHANISAAAIHGDKTQNARQAALSKFRNHQVRVLVATDIAARGIDIEEISHVINYDIPEVPETYVHRIGRTARAGHSGTALSFCSINEKANFQHIQRLIRQEIPEIKEHPYPMRELVPMTKEEQRQKQLERQKDAKAARERRQQKSVQAHRGKSSTKQPQQRKASTHQPQKRGNRYAQPSADHAQWPKKQAKPLPKKQKPVLQHVKTGRTGRISASKDPSQHREVRPDLDKYLPKPLRMRPADQPLKHHL